MSLQVQQRYESGDLAVQLDASGCGFCYYASGRVAACATSVSAYQRRFQFYDDDADRALIATFDEHAIGSVTPVHGVRLLLSKDGGVLVDANDVTTKRWRWDTKAQHAGAPPSEPLVIKLNAALTFTYEHRRAMRMQFAPIAPISVVFECGEQVRRTDSYLDHARRASTGADRGRLVLDQPRMTLQQRQVIDQQAAMALRSAQHPRSAELTHSALQQVVLTLEAQFDHFQGTAISAANTGDWKQRARLQSLREIPMLPPTGTELGAAPTLLGDAIEPQSARETLERLKNATTGQWLGSVELHAKLLDAHPALPRMGALTSASGRYSRELAAPGYVNGHRAPQSEHLVLVKAAKLDALLEQAKTRDELIVVACLREDDAHSRHIESELEIIQQRLHALQTADPSSSPRSPPSAMAILAAKCRLVKCDLAESSQLADRFSIHATPTFLIFYHAQLVEVSSLGGAAIRVTPATTNASLSHQVHNLPRVLVVHQDPRQQLAIEQVLRKEAFQWDLAISGAQAATFLRDASPMKQLPIAASPARRDASRDGYGIVLLSDQLDATELRAIDHLLRPKPNSSASIVVGAILSMPPSDVMFATAMCDPCRIAQGRRVRTPNSPSPSASASLPAADRSIKACPHCGILLTDATSSRSSGLTPAVLGEIAPILIYKHVKGATLHRLVQCWQERHQSQRSDARQGLTFDSFLAEMQRLYVAAKCGNFLSMDQVPSMALSAQDFLRTQQQASAVLPIAMTMPIRPVSQ